MAKNTRKTTIPLFVIGCSVLASGSAEVVLDGSLGPSGPLTGPDYTIEANMGQQLGNNLFHNFSDFNLNSNETASFNGPNGITAIVAGVSGGNPSSIDGQIISNITGANLYLINPAGIVFGENASLNISGSFYATSADYVSFSDGGRFDVSAPENTVLSSAPISAFGFADATIAPISVAASSLVVNVGKNIGLFGGDISIQGNNQSIDTSAGDRPTLSASSGRIDIVSVGSAGEIGVGIDNPQLTGFSEFADVEVSNGALVSVNGDPAGSVFIRAGQLVIENSVVNATTIGAADHSGDAVDIELTGDMFVRKTSPTYVDETTIVASTSSAGRAGNINITADSLSMSGDTQAEAPIDGVHDAIIASRVLNDTTTGRSGDININVNRLQLNDRSRIVTQSYGLGSSGDITINANTIEIASDAYTTFVSTSAFAQGNAGKLTVDATDITLRGGAQFVGLASQVSADSSSSALAGNVDISATHLQIYAGAEINSSVQSGSGRGGDINITSSTIDITGVSSSGNSAGIYSNSAGLFEASGDAGNINITAERINIAADGKIESTSFSLGDAGDINITTDDLAISGDGTRGNSTGLSASTSAVGGNAGKITIEADTVSVLKGGVIASDTYGAGSGGLIQVNAESLLVSGIDTQSGGIAGITTSALIFSTFGDFATGTGGSIEINTTETIVDNSGVIITSSSAHGDGGDITVNSTNITLSNTAAIVANSTFTGDAGAIGLNATDSLIVENSQVTTNAAETDGGDINITANNLLYLRDSTISASVNGGAGNGGNVTIDPIHVVLDNSIISANAVGGNGGKVTIVANNLFVSPDSSISASSEFGLDGEVIVDSPNRDLSQEFETLPDVIEDASRLFRNNCVSVGSGSSRFVVTKTGVLMSGEERQYIGKYVPAPNAVSSVTELENYNPTQSLPKDMIASSKSDCLLQHLYVPQ